MVTTPATRASAAAASGWPANQARTAKPPMLCATSSGGRPVARCKASTALLDGADNRHVPGTAHVQMVFEPVVIDAVLQKLGLTQRA